MSSLSNVFRWKSLFVFLLCSWSFNILANTVSPENFRDQVIAEVRKKMPDHAVQVIDPLTFRIGLPNDSGGLSINLMRTFGEYQANPDSLLKAIEFSMAFISESLESIDKSDQIRLNEIRPVIQSPKWFERMSETLIAQGAKEVPEIYSEALVDGLQIFYAQDRPSSVRYLFKGDLAKAGIETSTLRNLALGNLINQIKETPIKITDLGSGIIKLELDGVYDASLMLFDELWQQAEKKYGPVLILVPTRNMVLFVAYRDEAQVKEWIAIGQSLHDRADRPISPNLYEYREGKLTRR